MGAEKVQFSLYRARTLVVRLQENAVVFRFFRENRMVGQEPWFSDLARNGQILPQNKSIWYRN